MSIPPSNQPPYNNNQPPYGNQPYGQPPGGYRPMPPAKSGGGNGWKIAGFGCLGLFLLAAIGGVILVRNVKNSISHPQKNSIVGMAVLAGQAGLDGAHLQQAIVAYHTKHAAYPKTLMDLYSDGAIDGKMLHNGLDDNPDPAHVSWRYYPPAEGALGNTPILEQPYHITISGSTAPGKIVIDLNGKTESGQRQNRSYGGSGNDSNQGSGSDQGNNGSDQGSNGGQGNGTP